MKKIILVTNIPTPYRIPLFNEIDRQLKGRNIDFKVLFASRGYSRRKWRIDLDECIFQYEFLPSKSFELGSEEATTFSYSGLLRKIFRERPATVIVSGFSLATMKLWLLSWLIKTPYIIWSGEILSRTKSYSSLRIMQRKLLVKRASGFIAYGTLAKEYLISLGASPDKIAIAINTVDTEFFRNDNVASKQSGNKKRKELLTVSHLSVRKNIVQLLEIVKRLREKRDDFVLNIIGDGEEREKLERYVDEHELRDCVLFHGFKQKQDIVDFLYRADCFLFPTSFDIWGLVLVEAMAAGVPCIASVHAGATQDLIQHGITGYSVEFSNSANVLEIISKLLDDTELYNKISTNASQFIGKNVSIQHSSQGFIDAISAR